MTRALLKRTWHRFMPVTDGSCRLLGLAVLVTVAACGPTIVDAEPDPDDMPGDKAGDPKPANEPPPKRSSGSTDPGPSTNPPPGGNNADARPSTNPPPGANNADARPSSDGAPTTTLPSGDGGTTPGPVMPVDPGAVLPPQPKVVPVIVLEASGIKDDPKVVGRFKLIEDHAGTFATLKDLDGRPVVLDTKMGIELRGRTSQTAPKKAYSIELQDDAGKGKGFPILGMPSEADWVLYSCFFDRSCLRNALAYSLARKMRGGWHPRFQFVEVFMNGTYQGLYNVVERIKKDKNRLNIAEPAKTMAEGDITGGYMVRIEFDGKEPKALRTFKPPMAEREWVYGFPRYTDITADQKSYLSKSLSEFEIMMKGANFSDATSGYPKWIDVDSFVEHAIIREFARDVDAYRISAYMFKQSAAAGGKFHAGPVWDFDRAFGNALAYDADKTDGWSWKDATREANKGLPKYEYPAAFWLKLLEHDGFRAKMACRWKALRESGDKPFSTDNIMAMLDGWVTHIGPTQKRDKTAVGWKWDPGVPPRGKTHQEEADYLKGYVRGRASWLDRTLIPLCK